MSTINRIISGVRRADQIFYEQVGDKTTLEYGIAFHDSEYPQSRTDNAFREVWVETAEALPQAWDEVEKFYAEHDLRCHRWVPALGQSLELLEPFLLAHGCAKITYRAFCVTDWPRLQPDDQVRVLPARAMRGAFRELIGDSADIEERRLDYAQYDVNVATLHGTPVGRCGLLQVGEIANLRDLWVSEPYRRQRVGTTLVATALEMARRLMMKVVCLKVPADHSAGIAFLETCGFESAGDLIEFEMDPGH